MSCALHEFKSDANDNARDLDERESRVAFGEIHGKVHQYQHQQQQQLNTNYWIAIAMH